jgi:hypothetical protein
MEKLFFPNDNSSAVMASVPVEEAGGGREAALLGFEKTMSAALNPRVEPPEVKTRKPEAWRLSEFAAATDDPFEYRSIVV